MKKLILLFIIPFTALVISSCDTTDDPVTSATKGNIFVTSNPAGAEIWLGVNNTSQTTPDTIKNLDEGTYNVTLKLADYNDATFSVSVTSGQTSNLTNIVLVSNVMTILFGPVKIYETEGTTAQQPSGLDLSNGMAYGISSDEKDSVDIYYSSSGFLIQSAHLNIVENLIRETDFFVGNSDDLFDDVDSPSDTTGGWTESILNTVNNYVFLYDHDGHYSKLKIIRRGGGGLPGDPAWVDVQWYYNDTRRDNRF